MDFEPSARCREFTERLQDFMEEHVYPAEPVYEQQLADSGDPHHQPAVMEELKSAARDRGLWNMFLPDSEEGAGLSNSDYAPLAEILGRSRIASEATNCSAPDTGNMEVLHQFGDQDQKDAWLRPLLDGEIRSAFAMTEPAVASSDATNIALRIERDGDEYVLNGRKWWISGAYHPHCRIMIVMGKTNPEGPVHKQQSQILVPLDTPGVTVMRNLSVFGYDDHEGHAEIDFDDVRVPASNLIAGEGDGFMIAQARLGPGRIHHCMRAIGAAERALEAMCARAVSRVTFGQPLAARANIQDWIAESRDRNRDGPPADAEGGVADGHGRQPPGPDRDRGHQGGGAERGAAGARPRDPGPRRRRRLGGLLAGQRLRPPAHAAPGRRARRGPQALDRAARAGSVRVPGGARRGAGLA